MAIILQTQLSLFPNMPYEAYNDGSRNGIDSVVSIFRFILEKIHPDDEVTVAPHFFHKDDIKHYDGKIKIEGNAIYIFILLLV